MALIAQVDFNAGPDGAAVTTANAGVDGVFGTAPVYQAANAIQGAFSCRTSGAGTGNSSVQKSFATQADAFGSLYFYMPATVGTAFTVFSFADGSNNVAAAVRINTDLSLTLRDGATSRGSTAAIAAGALVRVELKSTPGSGAATACEMRVFVGSNAHGSTPTHTVSGVNNATAATAVAKVNAGNVSAGPDVVIDRLRVDDTAYPAPIATTPPTVNAGPDLTKTAGSANFSITATATPQSGATITGYAWTQVSGAALTLTGASTATVTVTPPAAAGTAVLRCTATDSNGLTGSDDVTVTFTSGSTPARYVRVSGAWVACQRWVRVGGAWTQVA